MARNNWGRNDQVVLRGDWSMWTLTNHLRARQTGDREQFVDREIIDREIMGREIMGREIMGREIIDRHESNATIPR